MNQIQFYILLPEEVPVDTLQDIVPKACSSAKLAFQPLVFEGDAARSKDIVPIILASSAGIAAVLLALSNFLSTYIRRPHHYEWSELEEVNPLEQTVKKPSTISVWKMCRKHALLEPQQLASERQITIKAGITGVYIKLTFKEKP